jgi:hypothetical protein
MQLLPIVVAPLIATVASPNRRFHLSNFVCMCISQFRVYFAIPVCVPRNLLTLWFWVYVFNFSILHFRVLFMGFGLIFLVWFLISMVLYHLRTLQVFDEMLKCHTTKKRIQRQAIQGNRNWTTAATYTGSLVAATAVHIILALRTRGLLNNAPLLFYFIFIMGWEITWNIWYALKY